MTPTTNKVAANELKAEVQKFSPAALLHHRPARRNRPAFRGGGTVLPSISSSKILIFFANARLLVRNESKVSAQLVAQAIQAAKRKSGLCAPAGPTMSLRKINETPNAPPDSDRIALSISSWVFCQVWTRSARYC